MRAFGKSKIQVVSSPGIFESCPPDDGNGFALDVERRRWANEWKARGAFGEWTAASKSDQVRGV
jgi:hypothetical protein